MLKIVNIETAIEEGLAYFCVPYHEECLKKLSRYVEEIDRWNRTVNITGIHDPILIVRELLGDAFLLVRRIREDDSILDLGSGAGALAVTLAILLAGSTVHSIDKSLRKIQFQRHIRRTLGLPRLHPVHGRSEDIPPLGVDEVVVKAFGSVSEILDKGGRHVKEGGEALILKGSREENPEKESHGFSLQDVIPYGLPGLEKSYKLLIYKKVS